MRQVLTNTIKVYLGPRRFRGTVPNGKAILEALIKDDALIIQVHLEAWKSPEDGLPRQVWEPIYLEIEQVIEGLRNIFPQVLSCKVFLPPTDKGVWPHPDMLAQKLRGSGCGVDFRLS